MDSVFAKADGVYYKSELIIDYKCNKKHFSFQWKELLKKIIWNNYDFVYIRYEAYANPLFNSFLKGIKKSGVNIILEIPTYPYDREKLWRGNNHLISFIKMVVEKIFRLLLKKHVYRVVTFSNDDVIFGIKTIKISNGIDLSAVEIKKNTKEKDYISLVGAAALKYWHGYDRLINGLSNYYMTAPKVKVKFQIIGNSIDSTLGDLVNLVARLKLGKYVDFIGNVQYDLLNKYFEDADIGIGSLGRHRTGITQLSALKNREYAARGIPFIYSENDKDFDGKEFVMKVPANETAIDVCQIVNWYISIKKKVTPQQIRDSVKHLDWEEQIQKIVSFI